MNDDLPELLGAALEGRVLALVRALGVPDAEEAAAARPGRRPRVYDGAARERRRRYQAANAAKLAAAKRARRAAAKLKEAG